MTGRRIRQSFATSEQSALLHELQAVDFALQELVLYLDAYPEEKEALNNYHALLEKRAGLIEALSPDTPMTIYDNLGDSWDWGKNPWPWELDAN